MSGAHQPVVNLKYRDCKDALAQGQTTSGIYTIQPDNQPAFQAYCDMETDGGGWMVFQRRMDGSVDFYRNWTEYQQGFGSLRGEFWLGLEKIHHLTSTPTELRVDLRDFCENSGYVHYTNFSIGDSVSQYILSVSGYSGTAGDSLGGHNGYQFSTNDQDNDAACNFHCAQYFKGAWWYTYCSCSNLNGLYHVTHTIQCAGVTWTTFGCSLKFSEMKLRQI